VVDKKESDVSKFALELARIHKRKEDLRQELVELDNQEKQVAFQLNSALGIIPIAEAAKRVQVAILRMKDMASKRRSAMMKNLWASKTPEERQVWKGKLLANRKKKGSAIVEQGGMK
jgi:hypothetical protein